MVESQLTLNEHLKQFNRIFEQFNNEKTALYRHVIDVLRSETASNEEKLLAQQIRNTMNSVYGSSMYSYQNEMLSADLNLKNIKVLMSPPGYGKTKFLVEEAIAMSEYGKVLYISHDNTVEHLKEMVYKNNIHNSGHYENICICYYQNIYKEKDKLNWLVKNVEKAIKDFGFTYIIIDGFDAYFSNINEAQKILTQIYMNFSKMVEIICTIQTPANRSVEEYASYLNLVPRIIEIKKERVVKENGDTYGTFEVIKNGGIMNVDSVMSELYHYKGEFLLRRAI